MSKCILSPSMCQLTRRIGMPDKLAMAGSSSSGKICYAIYRVNHGHLLTRCKELFITTRKRSLGQGNIFTSVCQEFCSQGGAWSSGGGCLVPGGAWSWGYLVLGGCLVRGLCLVLGAAWFRGVLVQEIGAWSRGVWRTPPARGRYASYWNAILFQVKFKGRL